MIRKGIPKRVLGCPVRAVHLDLKGVPPSFERLLKLVEIYAAAKYNAILVEWEGEFPWKLDRRFRTETSLTDAQVREFHEKARKHGLEIIPLIQCLGHLENVLRIPDYKNLREVPHEFDVLNPLATGARELIERMMDEVLQLSPDIRFFHLGGDEAWSFGSHPDTKVFIQKHGKAALYLHHIEPLLDKLNEKKIRPILWHDMMIHWDDDGLRRIAPKADLCVWGYDQHPKKVSETSHYHIRHIERFKKLGIQMWGACAWKCTEMDYSRDVPIRSNRLDNINWWAEVSREFKMQGVMATGWSRTRGDTSQIIPTEGALDLMVYTGLTLKKGAPIKGGLNKAVDLLKSRGEQKHFEKCRSNLEKIWSLRNQAWHDAKIIKHQVAAGMSDSRMEGSFMGPLLLKRVHQWIDQLESAFDEFKNNMKGAMDKYWTEQYADERLSALRLEYSELERLLEDQKQRPLKTAKGRGLQKAEAKSEWQVILQ